MESYKYNKIGYHGNYSDYINKVIKNQNFELTINKDAWLGFGVYFWEEDLKQAIDWCCLARKYDTWSIIKVKIKANEVLDLVSCEDYNSFIKVLKKVKEKKTLERLKKWYEEEYGVIVNDDFLNPLVLDLMYFYKPYKVVRHTFRVPGRKKEPHTNIEAMQVQVCVKKQDCIFDFKEVDDCEFQGVQ